MRAQAQTRFIGQPVITSTQIILEAINKERGLPDPLEFGVIPNSQNKPVYSLTVTYLIGAVILACMGLGVYLGVRYGW